MHTNNIIVQEEFGFRQQSSTENAAFKLTDNVLKSINQKMHVGGIFCDLTKAFDCVNHEILVLKLHYYSIQGGVANWFRSWQKTKTKKQISTEIFLKGSILGPLIFIIYINNLPTTINTLSEPILLADDTCVIISSKNVDFSTMSNTVLSYISKWFTSNKLVLNLDKTNIIKFITNHHSMT